MDTFRTLHLFNFICVVGSWSLIHHLPSSRLGVVLFVPWFVGGISSLLCHFAIAVLLIAFVSTMPLVGTLAAVYVGVGGLTTIHPNALADLFNTGMFLLRSQALLETMLAQTDEVPPSR